MRFRRARSSTAQRSGPNDARRKQRGIERSEAMKPPQSRVDAIFLLLGIPRADKGKRECTGQQRRF